LLRVAPGEAYQQAWAGTQFQLTSADEECTGGCGGDCDREVALPAGDYRVVAGVWDACPLADGCDCDDGSDPCVKEAIDLEEVAPTVGADFSMPASGNVDLVID